MKQGLLYKLFIVSIAIFFSGFAYCQSGNKEIVTIGNGTTASGNTPIHPWYGYSYTQTLYLQSELNVAGQMINQIGYQYAGTTAGMEVEIEVWLAHTSLTELTASVPLTGSTKVYDGLWVCTAGEEFSVIPVTPWIYNNTDNLMITIIEKKPGWNSSNDAFYSTATPIGTFLSVGDSNDNTPFNPNALTPGYSIVFRPNTRIWFENIPSGPAFSEITPTILNFGETPLGQGKTLTIQIKNTGADPLEVTGFTTSNDLFTVINTSFPFTLSASGFQTVDINFLPLNTELQSGVVTFLMDAAIAGDREVQVSGTGFLQEAVIVGTDTYANSNTPFYPWYGYSFTQTLYRQSELNTGVKMIDKIGYQYSGPSSSLNVEIEIYLGHTSLTSLSQSVPLNDFTKVYDGAWNGVAKEEFTEIDINPFFYNNTDNLIITFIEKKPGYNSSADMFLTTATGAEVLCVGMWNDAAPYNPNSLPAGYTIGYRPNTKFWISDPPTGPAISSISPLSIEFGIVQIGLTATQNVVLQNTGVNPLLITGANVSNGQFSLDNSAFPFTLYANASKTLDVMFTPINSNAQSGVITFLMDAGIAGDREVQVSGTGIAFTSIIIGEGTYAYGSVPVNARRAYSFSQTIYLQEELNFSNKAITRIGYQYAGSKTNLTQVVEVWMGHTDVSNTPWSLPLTGSTKVYDGPWTCHAGEEWSIIDISPFAYNNTDNLLITVIEKDPGTNSTSDKYYSFSVPSGTCLGAYSTSTPYNPNSLPTGGPFTYKANIQMWVDDVATGPAVSQITPTTLDYGLLEFGQTKTMNIVIKNTGADPLEIIGFQSTNDQFSVINTTFPIILNGSLQQTIQIKFNPTTTNLETGVVTFEMNPSIEGDKQVQVSGQMSPLVIEEFPWTEGFDGGALPDGWQNMVIEGNGFEFANNPFSHAFIFYFADMQRKAKLITPILDVNGLNPVKLGINHRIYAFGTGWSHQILKSDDGINWDVIAEFTEGFNPDDYQYMEFDITPAKSGEQVYIAFAVDYPLLPDYYEVVWEIESVTVFEPIPVFNVEFVVEDEAGNMLPNAVVTLNGVTNPAGNHLFEGLLAGVYNYSVVLEGYITANGQVTVIDQNVLQNVVLYPPVVINEFPWFEGFDSGALPMGWQNVINQGTGWHFSLNPFSHTYNYYFGGAPKNVMLVTPLIDLSDLQSATLGITHRVYAYETGWSHKIMMSSDETNWSTIAEYTEGWTPDNYRYMEFDITPEKEAGQVYLAFVVEYPVMPYYYEVVWEIPDVTIFEPIPVFNVNFVVIDDKGNNVNDAVVTLNGVTNLAGNYTFEGLEAGTYNYTVELEGYLPTSGQVNVIDQNVEVNVTLELIGQVVELTQGWSLISSYLTPESLLMNDIFSRPLSNQNMVILLGKSGIFWPEQNINTLGNWNTHEGYKIKMSSGDFINVQGDMVENKTVNLLQGISFLPVFSKNPVNAASFFNQVANEIQFAFDLSNELIYWPDGELFTLVTLEPGKAYLVKMSNAGSVTFEDTDGSSVYGTQQPISVKDSPWQVSKTGSTHIISIAATAFKGEFESGDILAVFNDNNVCVGLTQFNGENNNLGLVVYGDDFSTSADDGMFENGSLKFKLYRSSTQTAMEIYPVWDLTMPQTATFAENGLSKITTFKFGTLGLEGKIQNLLRISPNPAKNEIIITIPGNEPVQVEIIDQLGQVKLNHNFGQNENRLNISNLITGIYLLRATDQNNLTYFTKLIVNR